MTNMPSLEGYDLQSELGRGGMAVVYLARQRSLNRQVAIKYLHECPQHPLAQRFLLEARLLATLRHPHIVTVFDVVETDTAAFMVMEYLCGGSLSERIATGMRFDRALSIFARLGDALDYAHASGVIHRDVKPDNVMFRDEYTPVLTDFGIAREIFTGVRFTQEGVTLGTPAYMSPEQIEGLEARAASDIYSLGVLFFEMLTGHQPFKSPTVQGILSAHLTQKVPALPAPFESLQPVLEGLLAKSPAARYECMAEVFADLAAITAQAPELVSQLAHVPGTTTTDRLQTLGFPARRDAPSLTARLGPANVSARPGNRWLLVLLVMIAFGITATALHQSGAFSDKEQANKNRESLVSQKPRLAVLPMANLGNDRENDYLRDGLTLEIISRLSRLSGIEVLSHGAVERFRDQRRDPRQLAAELGISHILEGSILRDGERLRIITSLVDARHGSNVWSNDTEVSGADLFDAQSRIARDVVTALGLRLAASESRLLDDWGTRNPEAYDAYLRGATLVQHFHVRAQIEAAHAHFERALALDANFAPALAGMASAEAQLHRNFDSAPVRLQRARVLNQRALQIDPGLLRAHIAEGEILGVSYQYRAASAAFRKAIQLEPQNYLAWDYLCWSLGYEQPPALEEAEHACRRALDINPAYAEPYYHLARILAFSGRIDEARGSINHLRQHFPNSSLIRSGELWILLAEGRYDEAMRVNASKQFETALNLATRAMVLGLNGKLADAMRDLDQSLGRGFTDVEALLKSPYYAPLRAHPDFRSLLDRHGFKT